MLHRPIGTNQRDYPDVDADMATMRQRVCSRAELCAHGVVAAIDRNDFAGGGGKPIGHQCENRFGHGR